MGLTEQYFVELKNFSKRGLTEIVLGNDDDDVEGDDDLRPDWYIFRIDDRFTVYRGLLGKGSGAHLGG